MTLPVSGIRLLHGQGLISFQDKAETFEGAPAHVQVMGRPMKDEELIEVLKVVESTIAE